MGWSSNQLNTVSQLFVDACATATRPVLDIGAAYGVATVAALAAAASVIANDLDAKHLATLEPHPRLQLLPGRFPDFDLLPESLSAVHASNVLHFLNGAELVRGAAKIAEWLVPGGRVFVHAGTPYQQPFTQFIPEYLVRKAAGEDWPGYVEDTTRISKHRRLSQIPRSLHLLDDEVLTRVFAGAGLVVERAWMYRRHDLPRSMQVDGREGVGLVAVKESPGR